MTFQYAVHIYCVQRLKWIEYASYIAHMYKILPYTICTYVNRQTDIALWPHWLISGISITHHFSNNICLFTHMHTHSDKLSSTHSSISICMYIYITYICMLYVVVYRRPPAFAPIAFIQHVCMRFFYTRTSFETYTPYVCLYECVQACMCVRVCVCPLISRFVEARRTSPKLCIHFSSAVCAVHAHGSCFCAYVQASAPRVRTETCAVSMSMWLWVMLSCRVQHHQPGCKQMNLFRTLHAVDTDTSTHEKRTVSLSLVVVAFFSLKSWVYSLNFWQCIARLTTSVNTVT